MCKRSSQYVLPLMWYNNGSQAIRAVGSLAGRRRDNAIQQTLVAAADRAVSTSITSGRRLHTSSAIAEHVIVDLVLLLGSEKKYESRGNRLNP